MSSLIILFMRVYFIIIIIIKSASKLSSRTIESFKAHLHQER